MEHERRLYGHRGASAEFPENTLPAFRRALEVGAHCIESDVHRTADGEFVLAHDPHLERMSGSRKFLSKVTLAEIRACDVAKGFRDKDGESPFEDQGFRVPTFAEALEALPGVRFNVDMKVHSAAFARELVAFLRGLDVEDRVTLASFDAGALAAAREAGFQGETALGRNDLVKLVFSPVSVFQRLFAVQTPRAVQVPQRAGMIRFDRAAFMDKCHELGMRVDFWTINDVRDARRLLELGADGIMSDDPAVIAECF